ncbi:type II toxin-antitoxin system Phd/YefM family antitoxin [Pseudomonas vancouverensis]|nr:type II toxin-antitoxin system prevent-host-death family antitoxin [Pseudomonas vancouverensis]SDU89771.1 Antitoxin component of toxin-antitoxin stability system, DNA-binding transcriptional repressor [Pseudomonas vancouverensis]
MSETQSRFFELADRAWQGDRVVIFKDGKPYLDLLPCAKTYRVRTPGRLKGKIRLSADFDSASQSEFDEFDLQC